MSDSREQILNRVRAALAPLSRRAPLPDWDEALVVRRGTRDAGDRWALFAERLAAVNGTPLTAVADLVALLETGGWRHGYCDPALWPRLQEAFPAGFTVETEFDRRRIDDYQFGITAATGAIAETGTVILSARSRPGCTSSSCAATRSSPTCPPPSPPCRWTQTSSGSRARPRPPTSRAS